MFEVTSWNEKTMTVKLKRWQLIRILLLLDQDIQVDFIRKLRDELRQQLDDFDAKMERKSWNGSSLSP